MHLISLWAGKITFKTLQLFGRRGAALPGLIVERLDNNFLQYMLSKLPEGVVVISGTNGKTTTTKMVSSVLVASNKKVLTNPTGSNFTRGVVACIVENSTWLGGLKFDIAVIELDEAYAAKFVEKVKPKYSLILNVMRDQMDRYGEIDHTARLLEKVVQNTTGITVLNRDDHRTCNLKPRTGVQTCYYGVSPSLRYIFKSDDELHSNTESIHNGYARVELQEITDEKITLKIDDKTLHTKLSLYGTYNAQNACAAIAILLELGIDTNQILSGIKHVKPAFGRGERIEVNGKRVILQLVKNPSGFRHSLLGARTINDDVTLIAINDDYADGRDVSWLWDVDFKYLANKYIVTGGVRAWDMSLRLSYDDIKSNHTEQDIIKSLDYSLNKVTNSGTLHIYTTYTAMLKIRHYLSKNYMVEKV
jgi:lipid II isoglutaminyl synthase (glutamine-hydrolysing)